MSATTTGYEGLPYQITLDFNHRNPVLADVDVRKAIRQALDPQFIVDTVFLGFGADGGDRSHPADGHGLLHGRQDARTPSTRRRQGRPSMRPGTRSARTAPASRFGSGSRPSSPRPWPPGSTSSRRSRRSASPSRSCPRTAAPAYLQAVYTDHDFDLSINSPAYRSDPAISTTILFQGGLEPGINFSNQWGYENPELDQVIADGLTTLDTAARVEVYNEFQRIIADDLPNISLVDFRFTPAHRDEVQNVGNNPRWAVSNWADVWLAAE